MKPIEYKRMFVTEQTHWWYTGQRAIAFGLLDRARPAVPESARFLDAGCGSGQNLIELAKRGGTAVGVDIAPEAIAYCKQRGVRVCRGDSQRLPFPTETFDVVTSFDVLYHRWVQDDRAAARELVRTLRAGGLLLVRLPALRWLWGAHDAAVLSRHRYTRAELVALLQDAGLEVLDSSYCNTLLLPLLTLRRTLDRWTGRQGSDVGFLPAPFEWLFRSVLQIEARLLRYIHFPVGASVIALARKPGDGAS
jgi:SAM-dependent methyltransferase